MNTHGASQEDIELARGMYDTDEQVEEQLAEWARDRDRELLERAHDQADTRDHADTYMGAYPSVWSEEDESERF